MRSAQKFKVKQQDIPLFAKKLSKALKGGEVLALIGPLGAGKTTLTKHLGKQLGYPGRVTSPTFTLMQTYSPITYHSEKKGVMHHLDLYRTNSPEDLLTLDIEEYLGEPNAITVIEWADKFPQLFKKYKPILIYLSQ